MKNLLKILQTSTLEILDTQQLKAIKGGEVHENAEDMVEVE